MGWQSLETLASLDVPDAHTLVKRARDDEVRLWVEVATEDIVAVALESLEAFPAAHFPDLESLVIRGTDQQSAVRGPGNIRDAQFVPRDGLLKLAIIGTPNLDQFVSRRTGKPLSIGAELDRRDSFGVASKSKLQGVIGFQFGSR